ncbi:MAG: PepSY domain-containing protein [Oscillospiraceae bacterium]|nr:hypothetical protein [Oscillospiraceae bacterium]MBQ8732480.1 PepSY domain-containing protein [Oscillospiraceae bacterium]
MKRNDLENKLRSAVSHAAPDQLDRILLACGKKGRVVDMTSLQTTQKKQKKTFPVAFVSAAASVAIAVGVIFGAVFMVQNQQDTSVVYFDVNPSIRLEVNRDQDVTSATALNAEGTTVLGQMKLEGVDLDVAVNAIVGSMLTEGFLSAEKNAILVSVEDKDTKKATDLENKISGKIRAILSEEKLDGSVLTQKVDKEDRVEELADQYHISEGKAALILHSIAQDSTLTPEVLAGLSVHEIAILLNSDRLVNDSLQAEGKPSESRYIGKDAAKAAACAHAGLEGTAVFFEECEFDFDDGKMVYEVEFFHAGKEYEYEIDALTGAVVKAKTDLEDRPASGQPEQEGPVTRQAALEQAYAHAGVKSEDVTLLHCRLENEKGKAEEYSIKFISGGYRYEYEINATTGAVEDFERERLHTASAPASGKNIITRDEAVAKAFEKAGVSGQEVRELEVELEDDDSVTKYEISFQVDSNEYEIEVKGSDGSILSFEKELDD